MTDFSFVVDEAYARRHNEFFRDARRLQIAAGVLAALLVTGAVVVVAVMGVRYKAIALAAILLTFALLCLVVIPVLPRTMGNPQRYYDMYALAPAVVAEVNARDMVLLALVDADADPAARSAATVRKPALVARTVTSVPGIPREVGARVPSMAVTGVRTIRNQHVFDEISPMPVAWGTGDETVWRAAEQAIPAAQWARLEKNVDRLAEVRQTKRDLLPLT
ncbi:DUF3239 domain-containing protein [Corynebacterium heidelbergense]|uniref:DUF3239 domain-containing protein n=1 Tax=Corynebacterium heidelbergense TaxID=2055947 RepID=A0A364VCA4_9CORY|nr:DUF3239 domain-containing protein [Corynebacterium heidelbergense]RAV34292.1 DUF3239 domain-containing protein [Corynebacterium heidelbergense]WCZ35983.1 hypothetical protein CHEID_02080 [Corynebacterium heidelbergense]